MASAYMLQARAAIFTRLFHDRAPQKDASWQMVDWSALPNGMDDGLGDPGAYVVSSNWMQAARISYVLGPEIPIEVLPQDPRHFQYMVDKRLEVGAKGVFIGLLKLGDDETARAYA